MRDAFGTGCNRVRLSGGKRECAAAFQRFGSRFPPAFPFGFIKKIGNHPFADLLRGCLPIEAFQNVPDKRDRVIFGQLFGCGEVACLAREKMFRRNNGQVLGGVLELHRVGFFAGKIDQDLIEKKIPLCDPAKPPTLVQTERARFERVQFLGRFGSQFAGFDEFLELRVHESRTNYDEGSPWQAMRDNVFVFVLIFAYFRVPPMAQHRALVWGIVGALVMRGLMIWLGIELVNRFDFILYIFGAFLLVSAWRMFFVKQQPKDFGQSWVM